MSNPDYFSWQGGKVGARPVMISIPHSGRQYSARLLANARVATADLRRLEDRYVDVLASRVIEAGYPVLTAHVPRAAIDLNRSPHAPNTYRCDRTGLFPRQMQGAGALWHREWTAAERSERLSDIHAPYHDAIADALEAIRSLYGHAVLIDLHSMPRHAGRGWPPSSDVVLGDRKGESADKSIIDALMDSCRDSLRSCTRNHPYAGGFGVVRHGLPNENIHAVQVEVSRDLYLDGKGAPDRAGVRALSEMILAMADAAATACSDLPIMRDAAE